MTKVSKEKIVLIRTSVLKRIFAVATRPVQTLKADLAALVTKVTKNRQS